MPAISTYQCQHKELRDFNGVLLKNDCDFSVTDYGPYLLLKTEDGEVPLPHPTEESQAKKLTGKTLDELNKENKIIIKENKFCLKCLKMSDGCQCPAPDLIKLSELEGMRCPKCHRPSIIKQHAGYS